MAERENGPDVEEILHTAAELRHRDDGFHDQLMAAIYSEAERVSAASVSAGPPSRTHQIQRTLDQLLTHRIWAFPFMILGLTSVFWITIEGANVPSGLLGSLLLDTVHPWLLGVFASIQAPGWLTGVLVDGVYLATAWVVSVMLPPMAIFFPLFTLLEDAGYLPRVAFNLDRLFQRVGADGKQALTMSMGFGCNAAGVIATRIIHSPRERLIAILTNNFALCNGRWPTHIVIATIFIGALAPPALAGLVSAITVVSMALLGVFLTFAVSWALSRTLLKGEGSFYALELPPYRPPNVLRTLYTSVIDRTVFVLGRAVMFSAPAGAVLWTLSNIRVGELSLIQHLAQGLDPVGVLIGLNGLVLVAYLVAIPANEIVVPTILMLTVMSLGASSVGQGAGVMVELESGTAVRDLLTQGGWTTLTALNFLVFSLVHNPCSTTLYTIWKETKSAKWTAVSGLLPSVLGFALCFVIAQAWRFLVG